MARLAVFGATNLAARRPVAKVRAQGHQVTAYELVRSTQSISNGGTP